jgi:hypothetical protein
VPAGAWSEANTDAAIKAIPAAASWDASEVLRFGKCGNINELLIPEQMLGGSTQKQGPGPLKLAAHCYSSVANMKKAMQGAGLGQAPAVNFASFRPTAAKRGLELDARGSAAKVCQMQ